MSKKIESLYQSPEITIGFVSHWQAEAEKKREYFRRIDAIQMRLAGPTRVQLHKEGFSDDDIDNDMGLSLSVIDADEIDELEEALKREAQDYEDEFREPFPGNTTLSKAIKMIPDELGRRFDAHGIDRGSELQSLISLLSSGVSKGGFHTMSLTHDIGSYAMGATMPKAEGDIVVVGPLNMNKSTQRQMIYDANQSKTDIRYVVLGRPYYQVIDELRSFFPLVKFIRADMLVTELKDELPILDRTILSIKMMFRGN